jgi:predicted GNAT family acetyltransferase
MNDTDFTISFLKKLFTQNDDEKWTKKIEEFSQKIKFDNTQKVNKLELKQLNYNGDIFYLLFNKQTFLGYTQIRLTQNQIWIDITKIPNKLRGQGYGTILSNYIINIGKQNKQIKQIISQPDGIENGKEFRLKQGFENKGDLMILNIN